jgi:hypothetical protein
MTRILLRWGVVRCAAVYGQHHEAAPRYALGPQYSVTSDTQLRDLRHRIHSQLRPRAGAEQEGRMARSGRPSLTLRESFAALILAVSFVLSAGLAFGQKMPEASQGPSVAPSFILGKPEDYAGIDRCRSCNKPEFREYERTEFAAPPRFPIPAHECAYRAMCAMRLRIPPVSRSGKASPPLCHLARAQTNRQGNCSSRRSGATNCMSHRYCGNSQLQPCSQRREVGLHFHSESQTFGDDLHG